MTSYRPLRYILLTLTLLVITTQAHESCCKHKLLLAQQQQQQQQQYIPDPDDRPPLIDKPDDKRPADWDSDDDGDWAPAQIEDPNYKRRLILNPNYVPPPTFWDKLQTELTAALPWVTLGVVGTGLLSSLQLASKIPALIQNCNLLLASILGLATPLCSCGALPLCVGLAQSGVPVAQVLAFLTASQSAGLDSAAVTYGLLGGTALAARLLGAILLAVAVGLACGSNSGQKNKNKTTSSTATCHDKVPPASGSNVLPTFLSSCIETAVEIYPTVLAGLALSTAALHCLPSLTSYMTHSSHYTRLAVLGAALPLQLCEHTSVTLAGAIQKAGGSPGLAFALLLSAPATNLPTLLFGAQQLGVATAVRVALVLWTTAYLISWGVDALELDLLASAETGQMAQLPDWWIDASPHLAGTLLVVGYGQKFMSSSDEAGDDCCSSAKPSKAKAE